MDSSLNWKSELTAVERYSSIEKLEKSIEAKGLSSTGNARKAAWAAEVDAYNTATSRQAYDAACNSIAIPEVASDRLSVFHDPIRPGITIGPYQNCHHVASGIVSEVYRSQAIALKVITETLNVEPHNPDREVKILRKLSHAFIIKLEDTFRDQDGRLVLVFPCSVALITVSENSPTSFKVFYDDLIAIIFCYIRIFDASKSLPLMTSPFPASSSVPGKGHLIVELRAYGISALSKLSFQYPLKLISPSPSSNQKSVLVFLLTYGGGLVGGDQVQLAIDVGSGAKLSIVTQGHTKVFKSHSREIVTRQKLQVTIESGAAVCLLPDPVQPFAGSVYQQTQIFTLAEGASLILLDWVSAGRTARGEDWDFSSWSGRNEVWDAPRSDRKARLLLRDNILLEGDPIDSKEKFLKNRMHQLEIFGTLVLRGPLTETLSTFFLADFSSLPRIGARDFRSQEKVDRESGTIPTPQESWRKARLEQEKMDGVLWSAAKVRGCTVVKFGAHTVEGGRKWIGAMLKEESSIALQFGEDSLMCVRI